MRRILVLRGGALGDFIVTLPALALLRQRWPTAEIELVGNATAAALAHSRGLLTAVHSQHERRWGALFGRESLPAELAAWLAAFDLVINYWPDPEIELRRRFPLHPAQTFLSAAALPAVAPAAAHYCKPLAALGLETREYFFDFTRPAHLSGLSEARVGCALVAQRGAASAQPTGSENAPEHCRQSEDIRTRPGTATTAAGPLIIHPGSGSARKNWPAANWLALLRRLDLPVLLVLGDAEIARWRDVKLPGLCRLENAPLEQLVAHFSRCRLFLGHDSGVSHLAAACGAPSLLLFGPTDPAMWAPPAPHVQTIRRGQSLDSISVEEVRQAVLAALPGPG